MAIYNVDIGTGSLNQVGATLTIVDSESVANAYSASSDTSFSKLAFVVSNGKLTNTYAAYILSRVHLL